MATQKASAIFPPLYDKPTDLRTLENDMLKEANAVLGFIQVWICFVHTGFVLFMMGFILFTTDY